MMNKSLVTRGFSAALVAGWVVCPPVVLAQEAEEAQVIQRAQGADDPAEFTANIGVTSNYVWRGASQTGNAPAVQGGADYGIGGSGVYLGLWASNVDFGKQSVVVDSNGDPILDENGDPVFSSANNSEYELDGYIGWARDFTDNVGLDLGYVYYHYGLNGSGADFGELYANVSLWWFNIGVNYTPNGQADGDDAAFVQGDIAYYGAFGFDFAQSWNIGLTVGQYDFTNDSSDNPLSYAWVQLDLTKTAGRYGDFALSVSQAGEEADGNDNAKVFVSWTKGFYQKK